MRFVILIFLFFSLVLKANDSDLTIQVGAGGTGSTQLADDTHQGAISAADYHTFSSKLPVSLSSSHIYVGNGSNVATDVSVSGDLSLANTGAFTIVSSAVTNSKIANSTIDLAAKVSGLLPIVNGGTGAATTSQSFSFIGPTSGSGAPSFRALVSGDIPALPYSSSLLTSAHIFVGNGSNISTNVAVSGDVSLSNTGAATVSSVGGASSANIAAVVDSGIVPILHGGTGLTAFAFPAQEFYVTKDNGNDANDCSFLKPCKTIQAGINAANAISAYYKQTIVHVAPAIGGSGSAYNENITFSQQGVNLICDASQANTRACLISGTITINMTGTSGGANFVASLNESYMSGFVISVTGSNDVVTFSGTTFQRFIATNCYFDDNGTGSAAVISNSGTSGGVKSTFISYDSSFNNNNATNPTVALSNGRFWLFGTQPVIQQTTNTNKAVIQSGAGSSFVCNICAIQGQVQITDNTANATLNLSTISSGTAACVDTPASPNTGVIGLAYFGCTSTNTNSVTGSGVVFISPGNIRLSTSGDIVSTVTQAVVPGLPQGEIMLGAGSTTGTNVLLSIKNGHIKIDQTTSPTATVNANAGTGATCTLSNATDSAGTINLTTTAVSPATGTQCTINFNKAYGVAPICGIYSASDNSSLFWVSSAINMPDSTTTTAIVRFGATDAVGHTYKFKYLCVETK